MDIAEKHEYLDKMYGPAISPYAVCRRYIELGRQLGKTETLARAIAKTTGPCVLVCHRKFFGKEVLDRVLNINPDFDTSKVKLVSGSIYTFSDLDEHPELQGYSREVIYIDNAVWDIILSDMFQSFYSRG